MPWATTESPVAQRTLPDTAARSQTSKSYKLPSLWYSVSATEKGIRHFWQSLPNFSCYKDMHKTKDLPIQIYYSRLWPETSNLSVSKNHHRVLLKPVFSASPPKSDAISLGETFIFTSLTHSYMMFGILRGRLLQTEQQFWWSMCVPGMTQWLLSPAFAGDAEFVRWEDLGCGDWLGCCEYQSSGPLTICITPLLLNRIHCCLNRDRISCHCL